MSTLQFRRAPRLAAPKPPGGEVHLEPPPEIPRAVPGNMIQKLLPVVMILVSLGMVAFMFSAGAGENPIMLMMPLMMVVSTLGMAAGGGRGGGQKKSEMNEDRKDYLRYLGQMRDRAREAADEQRAALEWSHPEPSALWSIAASRRMWERRPNDADFCHVRVGRSSQRLATRLVPPETGPVDELEPITTLALRRFVRAHSIVPDLPQSISLGGFAAVALQGDRERTRALARAVLSELAVFHPPDDLVIAVASGSRTREVWDWVKWLPHAQHATEVDGIGQRRLMAGSLTEIEQMLSEDLAERQRFSRNAAPAGDEPHVVILLDEAELTREEQILLEDGLSGVTLIDLSDSLGNLTARRGIRLVVEESRIGARSPNGVEWFGAPDALTPEEAEALARKLSPYRLGSGQESGEGGEDPLSAKVPFLELLGIQGDPMTFEVGEAWRPRPIRDRYKVPFGVGEHGQPVELDIKEAAEGGMGPHGLCIGATGSGKSEFLRTLVLGMLATHSSNALNFVLVDFKGGATFNGFEKAPHVAANITNLEENLTQVARMYDALEGEMARRQEVLSQAGAKNVWDYEEKRAKGAELDPLPALFIVVDEFSELLASNPEFAELFSQIGRLGRSLQVHLLLASQRLEEGKLRGLDSHLSYRIGLKTFSASESRAAIGVPDAYELPSTPGAGYLKHDNVGMLRFQAAYVSGPYRPAGMRTATPAAPVTSDKKPKDFVPDFVDLPPEPETPPVVAEPEPEPEVNEQNELQIIVDRLVDKGPPAHRIWLPPLDEPPTLDGMFQAQLTATEDRGLTPVGFYGNGRLQVPVGILDMPYYQRQEPMMVDLSGASGHAAVVGGPQSGKSTLMRTLMASLALTHTPEEVQFYCLDFGGGTMAGFQGLPHVGGYASRLDPDTVRRTIAELSALKAEREQRFRDLGIGSMGEFRTRKRRGEDLNDPYGDVFLVLDGWPAFRAEFENLEQSVVSLAGQGLTFGIHVVVSANRWAEIRPAMKDLLNTRFELRLGDSSESEIGRKTAQNVPTDTPGRGLHPSKLHFLTALPRVDSDQLSGRQGAASYAEDLVDGVNDFVNRVRTSWSGRPAPQVRLLPEVLPYEQLPTPDTQQRPKQIPLGVNENALAPVFVDFNEEPHFYAFAEREAGKTALLRNIVSGITSRYTPQEALILLVDYRRTMIGFLNTDHLLEYTVSAEQLKGNVNDIVKSLRGRLPGPNITQEELKNRSWWSGPELFVVVDDYDLVAPKGNNPLEPLAEFLPQAKDVGLHMVLARNSGGASRAMFEPIVGKLKELSAPGLLMSAAKDEGQLIGNVKARPLPAGRGTMISRRAGEQLIQVGWVEPE